MSVLASLAILLLGFGTGLLAWRPVEAGGPVLVLRVLIVPSLLEEVIFRSVLLPDRHEEPRPVRAILPGLGAFVLWHVVAGLIVPGAAMFLRADFLVSAGLLGLACAVMRWRTGSLWPGVVFHAVAVWTWLVFLGGPKPF